VELHLTPAHQAGGVAGGQVGRVAEQQVQRRELVLAAPAQHRLQQRRARRRIARQQARTGHGREGHGDQRLGVVGQAMLLIGARPGPVEHVLAVGMALDVQRAGGGQLVAVPQAREARRPARLGHGAAAGVQCGQVGVAHERRGLGLLRQQGVPGGGGHVGGLGVGLHAPAACAGPRGAGNMLVRMLLGHGEV